MRLKPPQGEINVALRPIFTQIGNVHLIHDDVNFTSETFEDHGKVIRKVMQAFSLAELTLSPEKC